MPAPISQASHCAEKHSADSTSASSGSASGTDSDATFEAQLTQLENELEELQAQGNDQSAAQGSSETVQQQIAALMAQMGIGGRAPSTTTPTAA